jgi:hypothetical protein
MGNVMKQEMFEVEIRFRKELLAARGAIASGGLRSATGAGPGTC